MVAWSSVALVTLNANRNILQIAVFKISHKFQFSAETVENVQWSWNQNFLRCLRNRADGSWGKLICRASSYDNRLISFSNFSPTIGRPCLLFLPSVYKPDLLAKGSVGSVVAESPQERHICSVHVWLSLVYILRRWIQSIIM